MKGADLFDLSRSAGGQPLFTAYFPGLGLANEAAFAPGGIRLNMLLSDGTRIRLVSEGAAARMSGVSPVVAATFVVNRDVVEAIANSGPTMLRWTAAGAGRAYEQERSDRQREKYYRPMFACLAQHFDD